MNRISFQAILGVSSEKCFHPKTTLFRRKNQVSCEINFSEEIHLAAKIAAQCGIGIFRVHLWIGLAAMLLGSFKPLLAQEASQSPDFEDQSEENNTADPFANIPDLNFDEFDTAATDGSADIPQDRLNGDKDTLRWRSEITLSSSLASEGKIFRSSASDSINRAQSNLDNRLNLRALGLMLNFDLLANLTLLRSNSGLLQRKRLSIVAGFYSQANNENANNPSGTQNGGPGSKVGPELANFEFGFRQLYSSFFASLDFLGSADLELSAGKRAYSQAVSLYFNPINYLNDSGSFFTEKNNWQLLSSISWPAFALRLRYMPVLRFHPDSSLQANILDVRSDDYSSWEYGLSFLESENRRQLFSLEANLFLGESNWQLIGYAMEKQRYNWNDSFYLALGAHGSVAFSLANQYFQVYGEGLVGNGLNKLGQLKPASSESGLAYLWQDADLDEYKLRSLLGLKWTPAANLDIYFEYRYDGSALRSSQLQRLLTALEDYNNFSQSDIRQNLFWQGFTLRNIFANPFALTQHIAAIALNWRNIADHLDLQAQYFLSLPDTSSTFQIKASLYLFDRSLQLYCENSWYLPSFAASDYWLTGAFGTLPYLGSVELGLEIQK